MVAELHVVTELFEAADEGLGDARAIDAVEVLASEVVIGGTVAEHEVDGRSIDAATATTAFLGPRRVLRRANCERR